MKSKKFMLRHGSTIKIDMKTKIDGYVIFKLKKQSRNIENWKTDKDYLDSFYNRGFQLEKQKKKIKKILSSTIFQALNTEKNTRLIYDDLNIYVSRTLQKSEVSITEVGAGYGRLLSQLERMDFSKEIKWKGLELNKSLIGRKSCHTNIEEFNLITDLGERSDIIFLWAVMMYFTDEEIKIALMNLSKMSSLIFIYELPNTIYRVNGIAGKLSLNGINFQLKTIWSF
jgi:hypothetical protein